MLELYHHGSSVCAAKVRFALAEKKLDWQGHYIDILKGEQFQEVYLKINPKAVVPSLIHDGRIINESTVICEYLEETFPDNPIFPRDPYERHGVRLWTKAVDEDLHPACGAVTFAISHRHTVMRLGKEKLEEFLSSTPAQSVTSDWKTQKREWVEKGLDSPGAAAKLELYDRYLKKMEEALRTSEWLVGDTFGIADISLAPYVNRLAMMSMSGLWENGRLPGVADWFARLSAKQNFRSALIDFIPQSLAVDLATNGAKSWRDVARILEIA